MRRCVWWLCGVVLMFAALLFPTVASSEEKEAPDAAAGQIPEGPADADDSPDLQAAIEKYQATFSEQRKHVTDTFSGKYKTSKIDKSLKELVKAAFETGKPFPEVKALLDPYVNWENVPAVPAYPPPSDYPRGLSGLPRPGEAALDDPPRIFHVTYSGTDGTLVVAMLNSFVTWMDQPAVMQTSPYVVWRRGQEMRFYSPSPFREELAGNPMEHLELLGLIPSGNGVPAVASIHQPSTTAHLLYTYVWIFDPIAKKWIECGPPDSEGVVSWEYDPEKYTLTVDSSHGRFGEDVAIETTHYDLGRFSQEEAAKILEKTSIQKP